MARHAAQLRPLVLQDCDAGVLAHAVDRQGTGRTSEGAHEWQPGFVRGRSMMENVGELYTAARCAAMSGDIHRLAVLTLWDLFGGFPHCPAHLLAAGSRPQ